MCLNIQLNNIIFPDGTMMCLNVKLNNIIFLDGTIIVPKHKIKQYNVSRRNYDNN